MRLILSKIEEGKVRDLENFLIGGIKEFFFLKSVEGKGNGEIIFRKPFAHREISTRNS